MHARKWISLLLWIVLFQGVGFLSGLLTQANIASWYAHLTKSALTPQGFVFSIVWTLLYVLLAGTGWWLSQQKTYRPEYVIFWIQMLLNWAWTPVFFHLHQTGWGSMLLAVMLILNAWLIVRLRARKSRLYLVLIPYFLWLLFAMYLNIVIWMLNAKGGA